MLETSHEIKFGYDDPLAQLLMLYIFKWKRPRSCLLKPMPCSLL